MAPSADAALSVYAENFATTNGAGTDGTPVKARVNFFDVKLPKVEKVYLYSVSITRSDTGGEVKVAGFKKDLIRHLVTLPPLSNMRSEFATDYHSTVVFLTPQGRTLAKTVVLAPVGGSQQQTFNVTLTCTHTLAMSDLIEFLHGRKKFDVLPYMTALNILSRNIAAPRTVKVGRDKFFPTDLGFVTWPNSLNFRNGFFTFMRPVDGRVVLNIHGVSCAFVIEQPVHFYASAYIQKFRPNLAVNDLRNLDHYFKSIVKGLRVRLLYIPPTATNPSRSKILPSPVNDSKIKRINAFGHSAREQTFRHNVHGVITVEKYFNGHVLEPTSTLRFPHLLTCDLGTRDNPCFVPAELLYIAPHQPFFGKLPESAMRDMIRVSQRRPLQNVAMIEDCLKANKMFDSQAIQNSQRNGISISSKMKETNARMITIPDLVYKGTMKQQGCFKEGALRNGRWDLRNKKFRTSGRMAAFGVIEIGDTKAGTKDYKALATALTGYGLNGTHQFRVAKSATTAPNDLLAAAKQLSAKCKEISNQHLPAKDRPKRFLLIMLPEKSAEVYDRVKWWADVDVGAHTICVTPVNASRLGDLQFQGNLALKFNAKAGGHNHTLPDSELKFMHKSVDELTMFVGADVTHPGPGSVPHCPSIAAVVASDDKYAVNYPGSLRLQRSKQETIEDLDSMMVDGLEAWYAKNKSVPKNILFYRDGVSDSQFAMVKNKELPKVVKACEDFGKKHAEFKDYKPKITLVVCGKRHHTRFYPPAQVDSSVSWAIDSNSNFRPGLVVDDPSIRNAYHFDFYLQSHAALKGTARPCHYFVIHNDMGLPANALQRITFNLCWTFARALTPISYASPAYYADLLAERGRCYLAPFLAPTHPARPSEDELFAGLANARNATMEQKELHVLQKIKGGGLRKDGFPGWKGYGLNPFSAELADTMFYI